jgi:hypothetical protein
VPWHDLSPSLRMICIIHFLRVRQVGVLRCHVYYQAASIASGIFPTVV